MDIREIIRILMLSDFYFTMPLAERREIILRLWRRCGGERQQAPPWRLPQQEQTPANHFWPAS